MSEPRWRILLVAKALNGCAGLTTEDRRWLRDWWFTWGTVSDDEDQALGTLAQIVAAARADGRERGEHHATRRRDRRGRSAS